jgi:hypothetical protein
MCHAGTSGDIENARALYENALADEAGLANPEMWDAFLKFEHQYGTLRDVLTVEARRAGILAERRVAVPPWDSFKMMQQRYAHPCPPRALDTSSSRCTSLRTLVR